MKVLTCGFLLCLGTLCAQSQTAPPGQQQQPQAQPQTQGQNAAERSVLEVKPGEEAIKNKDLYDKTGYFHPFRRMFRFALQDQKKIWTSPFHTSKADAKWWGIFGGATLALIATDKYTAKEAPDTPALRTLGTDTSYLGAAYTLIPISAGFYFLGTAKHHDRFRETGLLCFETLIDTTIVETVIKAATDRARPFEGDGTGQFWGSTGPWWNASFPSGHAINTFGLASIFAHEYSDKLWVKILAYGYAGGVVGARLASNRHFPGDVVSGAAMGWFIGDYVYGKRHNPETDAKKTISQKILDHVHFGFTWE
jgi:membrane-associated phospholipid phosphatase